MKKVINKINLQTRQNNSNLAKQIANFLGLDYSVVNRSVKINYVSKNYANIIVNDNWDNKINFNLNNLK